MLKNFTILYVEDEEMVRKNAVEFLSRVCNRVLEAKDGKEAIKIWSEEKPDIIITDINMPRLNGLDMAAYIRASLTLPSRRVVLTMPMTKQYSKME